MSAIRIARPHEPVRLLDIGPQRARIEGVAMARGELVRGVDHPIDPIERRRAQYRASKRRHRERTRGAE